MSPVVFTATGFEPEQAERLALLARARQHSISAEVRAAVDVWLQVAHHPATTPENRDA